METVPPHASQTLRSAPTGELRLMAAVLEDALRVYGRLAPRQTRRPSIQVREIRAWIESTDRDSIFSFESICDALDIEPDEIRLRTLVQDVSPAKAA